MLKALTNFTVHLTDEVEVKHLMSFREGDLIYDPKISRHLLSLNCPVASVVDTTTVACPKCRTLFNSTEHVKEATIVLVNGVIQPNGFTFAYKAGQIIEHAQIREALTAAKVPLMTAEAMECPHCGSLFR